MNKFTNEQGEQQLALAEITYKATVNGEKSLTGTIYTNDKVLNKIDRGWYLEFNKEKYVITYTKPSDLGQNIKVEFDAVHEFFYKMGKTAVYSQLNDGSHTADEYLSFIFNGSGYSYQLRSTVEAFEKQSFGLKNRMALFNDFIDSTGLEFSLSGHTVTIINKVGSDLSTIVRKGFNLQELTLERNISKFVTYAKGFGAYLDENNHDAGRVTAEYISPLADIYGKLEADPVSDERYTVVENLQSKLKELVEGSYSISVGMTLEDLQKAGYAYSLPTPGDYILGIDEQLGFSQKVRIISTETQYDVQGNKQETKVTLNSISSVDEKIKSDASTSNTMNNIINGNDSIPNSWLEDATQIATEALKDTQTELKFTSNGILAIDKNDANNVVIFNSAGIGVSTNGGKTFDNAMTGKGINATAITAGVLRAIQITGVNISGSTIISKYENDQASITLDKGRLTFKNFDGREVAAIVPTTDANSGVANGSAILQYPGEILSINTNDPNTGTSLPLIKVPADSNVNDPHFELPGKLSGGIASRDNTLWISAHNQVILSGNNGSGNQLNVYGDHVDILGNFNVYNGSKNAVHPTRNGFRATPAYETAESYLGDIGEAITDGDGTIEIKIEDLFGDTINTDYAYQVFLSSYSKSHVWVSERGKNSFIVKSDEPNAPFTWELKGKRRGYEGERLVDSGLTYKEAEKIYKEVKASDKDID
ncbi:phage tail protein [Weissella oryzae]|nr:phage tail protein [Weissella oryzae]